MSGRVEGTHSSRRQWRMPGGRSRRRGQPGDRANLLRVQRFRLEQRAGNRIELFAMETEQAVRLSMALLHDATDFSVNQLGGHLAVGLPLESWWQAIFLRSEEADRADLLAHAPAEHHVPRDVCHLLQIGL